MLVGIANVIDQNLLGGTEMLKDTVCFFYIGDEIIAVLDNAVKLGVDIPQKLKEIIRNIIEKAIPNKE